MMGIGILYGFIDLKKLINKCKLIEMNITFPPFLLGENSNALTVFSPFVSATVLPPPLVLCLSPINSFYVLFVFIGHVFWKSVNIDLLRGGNAIAVRFVPAGRKSNSGITRNGTNVNGSWNHWDPGQ